MRDFSKGTTLDKDSALCLFHPTKNRLKSFIQFRWGQPKGLGVVIDDEARSLASHKDIDCFESHMSSCMRADMKVTRCMRVRTHRQMVRLYW